MIWHPGSIALLLASGASLLVAGYAIPFAISIIREWDPESVTERQFELERATHLISALLSFGVLVSSLSLFLFIAVTNDMSRLLVGAMCATGTLGANPMGWGVLGVNALLVILGGIWLALNRLDNSSPNYPLIRVKYKLLLLLLPLFAVDFALLALFFAGIEPDVITSCCGSLFSSSAPSRGGLISYYPRETLTIHNIAVFALWFVGLWALISRKRFPAYLYSLLSALFLPLACWSAVSFIAPYIYGLPWHHCPFDMFLSEYNFIGYPLFMALFGATVWGIMPVTAIFFRGVSGLDDLFGGSSIRFVKLSLASRALFDSIVFYSVFGAGMSLY